MDTSVAVFSVRCAIRQNKQLTVGTVATFTNVFFVRYMLKQKEQLRSEH